MSGKYYTYRYAYPQGFVSDDGTDLSGVIFYIGKGTEKRYNNRIDDHEAEARRGCSCLKCQTIRSIWAENMQVDKAKMLETDDEQAALAHEYQSILDYSSVYLTNVRNSPQARERRVEKLRAIPVAGRSMEEGYANKFEMYLDYHKQGKFKSDFDNMWWHYLDSVKTNGLTMIEYMDQFLATLPPDLKPSENEVLVFKEITLWFFPDGEALDDVNCSWY